MHHSNTSPNSIAMSHTLLISACQVSGEKCQLLQRWSNKWLLFKFCGKINLLWKLEFKCYMIVTMVTTGEQYLNVFLLLFLKPDHGLYKKSTITPCCSLVKNTTKPGLKCNLGSLSWLHFISVPQYKEYWCRPVIILCPNTKQYVLFEMAML